MTKKETAEKPKNKTEKAAENAAFLLDETTETKQPQKPYKVRDRSVAEGGSYTIDTKTGEYIKADEVQKQGDES